MQSGNENVPAILIPKSEVLKRVGRKKTWLHDKLNKGEFPRPKKVGTHHVAWLESDINEWIKSLPYADAGHQ